MMIMCYQYIYIYIYRIYTYIHVHIVLIGIFPCNACLVLPQCRKLTPSSSCWVSDHPATWCWNHCIHRNRINGLNRYHLDRTGIIYIYTHIHLFHFSCFFYVYQYLHPYVYPYACVACAFFLKKNHIPVYVMYMHVFIDIKSTPPKSKVHWIIIHCYELSYYIIILS